MPKIKVKGTQTYYMNVPEWFISNRGNGIISYSETEQCHIGNEIPTYTWIKNFMLNFSKDSVFLDVGAQMGLCTLPIAAEGYRVLAVEPVISNLKLLSLNIRENEFGDKVTVFPYAAHSEEKEISIFVPTEEDCASLSLEAANSIGKPTKEEKIHTIILDKFISNIDAEAIKFIKIDVQGAELEVLKGLEQTLRKPIERYVFMEWDPRFMQNFNSTPEELHSFMTSINYRRISPNQISHDFNGDALYTNKS